MKQVTVSVFKNYVDFIVFFVVNHFFELYHEYALVKLLQRGYLWHV